MNKLYIKKQLYGLQMKEHKNLLEHLNVFNMLINMSGFNVKVDEEDKTILPSYDHLVTRLMYGETLKLEEVTSAFLSHEKDDESSAEGFNVSKLEPR